MHTTNGHGSSGATERVALYLRVSSEEQRERETIELQRDFLEQYRSLMELEVVDVYEDNGVSGTIPLHERPDGRRLLEDAREGKFGAVLAYRLDRLGRSLLVIVDAHDRLQEAGVALRSATEPIDTSNPSGRLIFQMLASFAEFERASIRERTQAGQHRALRNGRHMRAIPYGYEIVADGSFVIVEEEARLVREICANVASGVTLYSEAKRLNDEGVPSPGHRYRAKPRKHGAGWVNSTVREIVKQRAYVDTHEVKINGGEERIEREVPAIVDPAIRQKALRRLEENKRYAGGRPRRNYLLSGLIVCAHCGVGYVGTPTSSPQSDKRYNYYGCKKRKATYDKRVRHSCPLVGAEWIEDLVWKDVRRFLTNPGEVLEQVREQLEGDEQEHELEERLSSLQKRLASKQAERDRAIRLYMRGLISEEEAEVLLADLKNQVDNLRLLISSVESDLSKKEESKLAAMTTEAWLLSLRTNLSEVEQDTDEANLKRRELVKLLVGKITVDRNQFGRAKVDITYRFGPPEAQAGEVESLVGVQDIQEITHERNLVDCGELTESFVRTMELLGDRRGPLLLQLPPSFTVEGMGILEDFLIDLPQGLRYAVEVRHKSWLGSDLATMLRERGAGLTLIDYPRMPRLEEATAGLVYIRWLGNRQEFPSGHTHAKRDGREDLAWWSERVDLFLSEGLEVFAYANNHYQNHSPSTLEQFMEIGRRGL